MKMLKRSLLIAGTVLLLSATIFIQYEEMVMRKHFTVYSYLSCDEAAGVCFVADCDSEDQECDTTPYSKVVLSAEFAPQCIFENSCEDMRCTDIASCEEILCSEDTLEEGERCSTSEESL